MKRTASDAAFQIIRDKILGGEWPQGTKIATETEIARMAGVSRSSVREATERLALMGVLARRQGDGTYVKNDSPRALLSGPAAPGAYDAMEVLEFREMVEPEAVRRLIRRGDPAAVQVMVSALDEMARYADLRSSDEFARADLRFHTAVLRGAHNAVLDQVIALLQEPLVFYQFDANQTIGPRSGVEEHSAIVNAIFQRDEELAALLLKRHLQRSRRDLAALREQTSGKEDQHE